MECNENGSAEVKEERLPLKTKSVSRREFLKIAGVAGAMVTVGGGLGGLVAACGGGDETTTTAGGATTTTGATGTTGSSGADADKLVMGGMFTLTGEAAWNVVEQWGAQLAIEDFMANGGIDINGEKIPIEFKYYDVGVDPAKAVDFTRRLIDNDKAKVISGARENTQLAGELKITDPAKVIVFSMAASTPLLSVGSQYGFSMADNGAIEKHALFQLIQEPADKLAGWGLDADRIKAVKKVALFGRNELYVQQGVSGAKESCDKFGYEWAGDVLFPPGTTDFLPYVQKLKDLAPDAVVFDLYSLDMMIPCLKDMTQVGGLDWQPGKEEILLLGNDVLYQTYCVAEAVKAGLSLDGCLCFSGGAIDQEPERKARADAIAERVVKNFGETPYALSVAGSYDSAMFILKGIEAGGSATDGDKMKQGILSVEYSGTSYDMKMNPSKQILQPEFMMTVIDGAAKQFGAIYTEELYWGYAEKLAPALEEVIK